MENLCKHSFRSFLEDVFRLFQTAFGLFWTVLNHFGQFQFVSVSFGSFWILFGCFLVSFWIGF